jgi:hypothetical protein
MDGDEDGKREFGGVLPKMGLAPSTRECTKCVPQRASAFWGQGRCAGRWIVQGWMGRDGWEEMDAVRTFVGLGA